MNACSIIYLGIYLVLGHNMVHGLQVADNGINEKFLKELKCELIRIHQEISIK